MATEPLARLSPISITKVRVWDMRTLSCSRLVRETYAWKKLPKRITIWQSGIPRGSISWTDIGLYSGVGIMRQLGRSYITSGMAIRRVLRHRDHSKNLCKLWWVKEHLKIMYYQRFPYTTPGHYSENPYLITLIFWIVPLGLCMENSGTQQM